MEDGVRQAAALQRQGRLNEAAAACESLLAADGEHFDALHLLALLRLQQGRPEEAAGLLERALRCDPTAAEAHYHLAYAARRLGRHEAVVRSYRRALELRPDFAEACFNLGGALRDLGRREEALEIYRRFLALRPAVAEGHHQIANLLKEMGRWAEAEAGYRRCIALQPAAAEPHFNLGVTLRRLGRDEEAVESYRRALAIRPDLAPAHNNLGAALRALQRPEEALGSFRRAVALAPRVAAAHDNLGAVLSDLGRHAEALPCHLEALRLQPDMADAHYNLGCALAGLERRSAALAAFRRALAFAPRHAGALFGLVQLRWNLDRPEQTLADLRRLLQLAPDHPYARGALAFARRRLCDWSSAADDARTLVRSVRAGRSCVQPFPLLAFCDQPADLLRCARRAVEARCGARSAPLTRARRRGDDRVRLGYLSADFGAHPLARLMVELYELHDRERFEVLAFAIGADDRSPLRRRLENAFDGWHDLQGLGHRQAAAAIAATGTDILIDLNGHNQLARPQILSYRPAPLQVNYLGFPGTMGAGFVDYILVDSFVVPADQQPHFAEKLVHLPDCYQVNDRRRSIDASTPSRAACGLPEHGFVFCAFNANYKLTPEVFDVWMRLLDAVPGSVLWLSCDHPPVATNLRREAALRGVDANRLVFAPFLEQGRHLARHRLADLFLDTLPYNAHTTASDALWAGLPVLTCAGRSFAGRVAGSLLRAIGLPELVTASLEAYEAAALALARDPARLAGLRDRLARQRDVMPLYDTPRQTRSIERAYGEMWRRHERALPPAPFVVG